MLRDKPIYLLSLQRGEDLDIALRIIITYVEPELIELIRRGIFAVEPDITALGLSELAAVGFGDEGASQRKSIATAHLLDEFSTRCDIAPLVGAAHLEFAVLVLVQIYIVVALEQLIGELGEGHTLRELAIEAFLHGVFRHHVVDRDQFAHVAGEIEEGIILHPIVVVDQFRRVGCIGMEVEETLQLALDALLVVAEGGFVEQVTLCRLAAGVANHTRCAADEGDRLMPTALQMAQHHDAAQVPDMEAVRRRVYAHIRGGYFFHQLFFRAGHDVLEHAAPTQFFYKILHRYVYKIG